MEQKARGLGLTEAVVNNMGWEALFQAMDGNRSQAVRGAEAILKQSQTPTVLLSVASIYALAGEDAKVEPLVERASELRPDDLNVQSLYSPAIRAQLAMNHHDDAKALDLMKKAEPFDRSTAQVRYTRATALLLAGRSDEAAQEFRAVLNLKGYMLSDPTYPLAQLGLARALVTSDKAAARTAYQDFFALWKNGDPDIPVLTQAKLEYSKLQ